jgi:hypothetical protein
VHDSLSAVERIYVAAGAELTDEAVAVRGWETEHPQGEGGAFSTTSPTTGSPTPTSAQFSAYITRFGDRF